MNPSWKKTSLKLTLYLSFFALIIGLFAHEISFASRDVDLPRHLANGQHIFKHPSILFQNTYAQNEATTPFVNHHWLFGLIITPVYHFFGATGLVIFKCLFWIFLSLLLYKQTQPHAPPWIRLSLGPLLLIMMSIRSGIRPELFSYLFTSLYLIILQGAPKNPKNLYWLIPIQVLWVNTHIYFFIGPVLVLAFLWQYRKKSPIRPTLSKKIGAAIVLSLLLNPNTLKGALYPLLIHAQHSLPGWDNINPWLLPPSLQATQLAFFTYTALLGFALFKGRKNLNTLQKVSVTLGIIMGLMAIRNIALMGILTITTLSTIFTQNTAYKKIIYSLPILATFFLLVSTQPNNLSFKKAGLGHVKEDLNTHHFLNTAYIEGPIFTLFDTGSYLIWSQFPHYRPSIDNRSEAYTTQWAQQFKALLTNPNLWEKTVKKHPYQTLLLRFHTPIYQWFIYTRLKSKKWKISHINRHHIILTHINSPTPAISPNKIPWIKAPQTQKDFLLALQVRLATDPTNTLKSPLQNHPKNQAISKETLHNIAHQLIAFDIEKGLDYYEKSRKAGKISTIGELNTHRALKHIGKVEESKKHAFNARLRHPIFAIKNGLKNWVEQIF